MRTRFLLLPFVSLLCGAAVQAPPGAFEDLKAQAEKLYAEHSYSKSHELYQQVKALELKPSEARWVQLK